MNYPELGGGAKLRSECLRLEIVLMESTPKDLKLSSEVVRVPATDVRRAGRFQVIVEYTAGTNVVTANADLPEEGVEAFMQQMPGCKDGEISLVDREQQRVLASVKWRMGGTEIGLRVPLRENVFHDWHLALIASDVRARHAAQPAIDFRA